jgi:hypothetical protein
VGFSEALQLLKAGRTVRRLAWDKTTSIKVCEDHFCTPVEGEEYRITATDILADDWVDVVNASNVISMAEATQDGSKHSPRQALEWAIKAINDGEQIISTTKQVLILFPESRAFLNGYDLRYFQAGMSGQDWLPALEVAKIQALKLMGYD